MLHGHDWKTWAVALAAMGCAGCGAPIHKDYAGADSAKLRVVLNDPKGYFLWASLIAPSTCKQVEVLWPLGGDNRPDSARVGMLDPKPVDNSNSETRIPARKTILRFSSLATVDAIDVLFAMTPTTQADSAPARLRNVRWLNSKSKAGCSTRSTSPSGHSDATSPCTNCRKCWASWTVTQSRSWSLPVLRSEPRGRTPKAAWRFSDDALAKKQPPAILYLRSSTQQRLAATDLRQ